MRIMNRLYHGLLGLCLGVLSLCVGPAFAKDLRPDIITALSYATEHGAYEAKFKAEQAHATQCDEFDDLCTSGKLARESNGFRLSEMLTKVAATFSEVAKGKIGVGAGAVA